MNLDSDVGALLGITAQPHCTVTAMTEFMKDMIAIVGSKEVTKVNWMVATFSVVFEVLHTVPDASQIGSMGGNWRMSKLYKVRFDRIFKVWMR
jgi:hypothetical protein